MVPPNDPEGNVIHGKRVLIAFMLIAPFFLLGAKCIENDSLRKGPDGDWHIYGEIHNETTVQGAQILLQGTFYDGGGNVIGIGQAPLRAPELSPGTSSCTTFRSPICWAGAARQLPHQRD